MVLAPPRAILNDRAHVSEIGPWPAECGFLLLRVRVQLSVYRGRQAS